MKLKNFKVLTGDTPINPLPVKNIFEIYEEITFEVSFTEKGKSTFTQGTFVIPVDFEYNGASTPSVTWFTIGHPYTADFIRASILHDFHYSKLCSWQSKCKRRLADEMFYHILRIDGVSRFKARRMYIGVRIGGMFAWKKNKGIK